MDKGSLKIYFKYVQDVLGIKQIFTKDLDRSEKKSEAITLLVKIEELQTYSTEENNLLQKMISALQLDSQQILIVDSREVAPTAQYLLNLVDHRPTESTTQGTAYTTWSPRRLLKNPNDKKEAWSVMQMLLQQIKP